MLTLILVVALGLATMRALHATTVAAVPPLYWDQR